MRRVMITGVGGMVGSHLAESLIADGHQVVGTFYRPTIDLSELSDDRLQLREMDVRYAPHVSSVVEEVRPDWIFHLAAQSYPTVSWDRPQETLETNVVGTTNVFEAVRSLRKKTGYAPTVVAACSSAQYGASLLTSNGPISEGAEFQPLHPYGVSKVATDLLAYQYFKSDGIRSIRARIFNSSGPRKRGDVISDFARRIAALPGEGGALRVGNVSTRRAFLHVRDLTDALVRLADRGREGEAYNISGVEIVAVADLIPMFEKVSNRRITIEPDPSLLRPTDEPLIAGNTSKILNDTEWRAQRSVFDIVRDVYLYEARKAAERSATNAMRLAVV